jgi:hypothetical protein
MDRRDAPLQASFLSGHRSGADAETVRGELRATSAARATVAAWLAAQGLGRHARRLFCVGGCGLVLALLALTTAAGARSSVPAPGVGSCPCSLGVLVAHVEARAGNARAGIDPLTARSVKLVAAGEAGGAAFGSHVALSANGKTALVGGAIDDDGRGAVWVFRRAGSGWVQEGRKLVGGGEVGPAGFGWGLALSADGATALIGGPDDDHEAGAVWAFVLRGSHWVQQGRKLAAPGEAGRSWFGFAVALSGDGSTALVGGPADAHPKGASFTVGHGAAWIFHRTGTVWHPQGAKLTGRGDGPTGAFGTAVSLSADGATALISAPDTDPDRGAAWVFARTRSGWHQQGPSLTGAGERGNVGQFGAATALSADGNVALIGGPGDNDNVGASWVFTRTGTTWKQQGPKLTARDETGHGAFGISVALSQADNTALIGGWQDNHNRGAVWLFRRTGDTWLQIGAKHTAPDDTGATGYGIGLALSTDGTTALIGGGVDNRYRGAAWTFEG